MRKILCAIGLLAFAACQGASGVPSPAAPNEVKSVPFQIGQVYSAKDQAAVCSDIGNLGEVERSGLNDRVVQADGCVVIGSIVKARVLERELGRDGLMLRVRVQVDLPNGQKFPGLNGYEGWVEAANLEGR